MCSSIRSWRTTTRGAWMKSDGTLRHVSSRARFEAHNGLENGHEQSYPVRLAQWMRFSRYGERLHIHLPAACAK